ncbi:histidine kinase G2 [Aspergillus sclerotiicarbonarius CBS 121057]|uniref:histidine kinase n=1 Tax=Aspergillus sclerotiicarbonarius (strain CBS 121057 / IBT 28362) TaxID=1448318 RepID=A0A319F1Z7_ASPSB|nr:histidine kinase G2 [Aspergillus sclerotiicarbonarius CBS 121057]
MQIPGRKNGIACQPSVSAQQLADMMPTGLAIVNHQDQSVFANKRFLELTTCSSEQAFDCWRQTIHPEDLDRVTAAYREASQAKHALRIEYRTRLQPCLWRVCLLTPLEDKEERQRFHLGPEGGFVCTITDITQEKMAELTQRRIAHEAEERKQQQERFIDMISHEVRNPLSAILHCTEDILEAVHQPHRWEAMRADIAQAADTISLCVAHQKKIIDDVLTYSKLDASMLTLSPRCVQPRRNVATALAMFRPELRKHAIKFDYQPDESYAACQIDWVMADMDRMSQVLINLLSNAIKFTARSGDHKRIRVSIGAAAKRPPSYPPNVVFFESGPQALKLDATVQPEWGDGSVAYLMVAVKDTGIGISDEAQKRLFERFNQATPRTQTIYGGSGLGLNVSRRLCHLHGGEIGVSSKEGEGSTFGFFFTVRRSPAGQIEDSPKSNGTTEIDRLCSQIQAIGNEMSGVDERTPRPHIPESPPVTHVEEISPHADNDDRLLHTARIANQASPSPQEANTESHPQSVDHEQEYTPGLMLEKVSIHPATSQPASKKRILLVEDNVINKRILSRKLQSSGYHVWEASNGQEAVEAVRNETFDCVLMDQVMPVMDGTTATRAIRALDSRMAQVPILGVTANVRAAQKDEMLTAGMNDIIYKPYKMQDLVERINQVAGRAGEEGPDWKRVSQGVNAQGSVDEPGLFPR